MVGAGSHTTTPHDGGATEMVNVVIVSMETCWISSGFSVSNFPSLYLILRSWNWRSTGLLYGPKTDRDCV